MTGLNAQHVFLCNALLLSCELLSCELLALDCDEFESRMMTMDEKKRRGKGLNEGDVDERGYKLSQLIPPPTVLPGTQVFSQRKSEQAASSPVSPPCRLGRLCAAFISFSSLSAGSPLPVHKYFRDAS